MTRTNPNLNALCFILAAALLQLPSAAAHDIKGMSTQADITKDAVSVTIRINVKDVLYVVPGVDMEADGQLSESELEFAREELLDEFSRRLSVSNDGQRQEPVQFFLAFAPQPPSIIGGTLDQPHVLEIKFQYRAEDGKSFGRLKLNPNLFDKDSDLAGGSQKNLVNINDRGQQIILQCTGTEIYETVIKGDLSQTEPVESSTTPEAERPQRKTRTLSLLGFFTWEGVLHILLGWDHIFFIVGLILLADNLRKLITIVTGFTVAHSITLILVALDVIRLGNPRIVEAIIALSIAYVGVENLICLDREVRWRWILASGFGLIHGMGFASALKQSLSGSLPPSTSLLVGCLLVFNLGVELGQLAILSVLYPGLQAVRVRRPRIARRIVILASAVIVFMGATWLIDRVFMPGVLPWVF
tara:strand:- start:1556 stop:2800 length:1245 start_codon:yes stop_codon:yes gene_type:complete